MPEKVAQFFVVLTEKYYILLQGIFFKSKL